MVAAGARYECRIEPGGITLRHGRAWAVPAARDDSLSYTADDRLFGILPHREVIVHGQRIRHGIMPIPVRADGTIDIASCKKFNLMAWVDYQIQSELTLSFHPDDTFKHGPSAAATNLSPSLLTCSQKVTLQDPVL